MKRGKSVYLFRISGYLGTISGYLPKAAKPIGDTADSALPPISFELTNQASLAVTFARRSYMIMYVL